MKNEPKSKAFTEWNKFVFGRQMQTYIEICTLSYTLAHKHTPKRRLHPSKGTFTYIHIEYSQSPKGIRLKRNRTNRIRSCVRSVFVVHVTHLNNIKNIQINLLSIKPTLGGMMRIIWWYTQISSVGGSGYSGFNVRPSWIEIKSKGICLKH